MFNFGEQFTEVTFETFHKFNGLYTINCQFPTENQIISSIFFWIIYTSK